MYKYLQFEASVYLDNSRLSDNIMTASIYKENVVLCHWESKTRKFGIK